MQIKSAKHLVDMVSSQTYFHEMQKIGIVLLFTVLILPVSIYGVDGSYSWQDIEFPIVRQGNWLMESDTIYNIYFPHKYDLIFFIDGEGDVDSLKYSTGKRDIYIEGIYSSLENLKFFPARWAKEPVPFILPAEIEFFVPFNKPIANIRYPFDYEDCRLNPHVYRRMLNEGSFRAPDIISFPSYYCLYPDSLASNEYPFAVYELFVDKDGELVDFNPLFVTDENVARQIPTVLLYSKFSPAAINGNVVDSKFYLIVRFFNELQYPTSKWPNEGDTAKLYPYEYVRLETTLFLDSVLHLPYPKNVNAGIFRHSERIPIYDTVFAAVNINKEGKARITREWLKALKDKSATLSGVLEKLKFIPARNLSGDPVEYEGRISVIYENSKNIRIIAKWLPDVNPEPVE